MTRLPSAADLAEQLAKQVHRETLKARRKYAPYETVELYKMAQSEQAAAENAPPAPKPVWTRIPRSGQWEWRPDGALSDDDLAIEEYVEKIQLKQKARTMGLDVVPAEEVEPTSELTPQEVAQNELRELVQKEGKGPADFLRISELRPLALPEVE